MPGQNVFKRCPSCNAQWKSREIFLLDRSLEINGYQADPDQLDNGLFFFTHHVDGCFSTMVVESRNFFSLYDGEKYSEIKMGSDECPGYCLKREELDPCEVRCEYAFVREVIQKIKEYQRN